jgi:uncharacterized membrane protein
MWCETVRRILFAMAMFAIASMLFLPVQGEFQLAQSEDVILDPVEIRAILTQEGVTLIGLRARAINQGSTSVDFLSFRIESLEIVLLEATANGSTVTATSTLQERYTEVAVVLTTPLEENDSVWVEIELEATDLQSDPVVGLDSTKLYGDFSFYIRPMPEFANFTFTAILPRDAVLSRNSAVPLFPSPDSNFTDGSSLAFVWFRDSLLIGQEIAFTIRYQYPNTQSSTAGSFLVGSIIIALLGIMVGIILTVGGPRLYHRLKRIGSVKFVGVTSEEEEVLKVIRQKGGSCPQKDLYTEFDMSQAKVSLILNNLEERGLVRRFREGRENVVHIMEE